MKIAGMLDHENIARAKRAADEIGCGTEEESDASGGIRAPMVSGRFGPILGNQGRRTPTPADPNSANSEKLLNSKHC